MNTRLTRMLRKVWPVGIDSPPIGKTENYKQAKVLKSTVARSCAGQDLTHVLALLTKHYEHSHSRRDQINARAQSLIQLTSALAALIYTGVVGTLIASATNPVSRLQWPALAYGISAMFFLFSIQCALKCLRFQQYMHPDFNELLEAGKVEQAQLNAELLLSIVPSTAFNEEQNDRKATILNYAYFYLRAALWSLFLVAVGMLLWKFLGSTPLPNTHC